MRNIRVLVVLCFLVTLAAGVAAGLTAARTHTHTPPPAPATAGPATQPVTDARGWLSAEMGLTPEQDEKAREIWDPYLAQNREFLERRRQLEQEREREYVALLTTEQKALYDKVRGAYDAKLRDVSKARGAARDQAIAQTRDLLNEAQRAKFDEMLRQWTQGRLRPRDTSTTPPPQP